MLAALALAAGPDVKVKLLAGESSAGRLAALATDKVVLVTGGSERTLAAAEVMWLEFPAAVTAKKPTTWIELLDDSKLQATSYTAAAGKARIELTCGQAVELPTRAVRTVRFQQQQTPELVVQWREITSSMATGDMVVIRKTSLRTVEQGDAEPTTITEQALDQVEGTLMGITADTVEFESGGEKINIRREKLEGLVYYHPTKREFAAPVCRLIDAGGSTWPVRELRLVDGRLAATSVGNLAIELPLTAVAKVDFSVGNVLFLSDIEPDTGGGELTVSLQPAGMSYKFGRVFQVRSRPPLGAEAFRIGGATFDTGLSLHSPLSLVYRVPEGFQWLRAVAGVDDSIIAPGRFDLVVLGDGKELMRHAFLSDQPRRAVPIDLQVTGVRRISLVLDPTDGQDIGDQLNLCEARFTK